MNPDNQATRDVDAYIAACPGAAQALLLELRRVLRQALPQAQERISYRMPALFQHGAVVYYAAFKRHIGLYPPVADAALRAQLAPWAGPKGNLQFPMDQPLPWALIEAVARSRLQDNLARAAARRPAAR